MGREHYGQRDEGLLEIEPGTAPHHPKAYYKVFSPEGETIGSFSRAGDVMELAERVPGATCEYEIVLGENRGGVAIDRVIQRGRVF